MPDQLLIRHCAPTLAGIKTGNMFTCAFESKNSLMEELRRLNRSLSAKGLRAIPLRIYKNRALIYLFRPNLLAQDFSNEITQKLLTDFGYESTHVSSCIVQLIRRMKTEEFPHEVGLFLGYPPEDVLGFVSNNAGAYKCTGHWKVYGDEQKAKKLFHAYKTCTEIYCRQWENGASIEALAVAG